MALALVYMAASKFKSASQGEEKLVSCFPLKDVVCFQYNVNVLRRANLLLILNLSMNSLHRIENTLVQTGSASLRFDGLCILPWWDGWKKVRPLPVLCGVRQSLWTEEGSQQSPPSGNHKTSNQHFFEEDGEETSCRRLS